MRRRLLALVVSAWIAQTAAGAQPDFSAASTGSMRAA